MSPAARHRALLRTIAAISAAYDVLLAVVMLAGRDLLAAWLDVPKPVPPIHADLNAVFLFAVGAGYVLPWRDPERYRGYLWVMGPLLKGTGAAAFLVDHLVRRSSSSFLLFALTDGALALATLVALLVSRPRRGRASA
jgi:hypothetical protein